MTAIQVDFEKHLEQSRHNKETEKETQAKADLLKTQKEIEKAQENRAAVANITQATQRFYRYLLDPLGLIDTLGGGGAGAAANVVTKFFA